MKAKTPTEEFKLSDAWNGFKTTYLPFVDWTLTPDDENTSICVIKFLENEPTLYTNKWNREQYKIEVEQNGENKILSAGKRLFAKIGAFCIKNAKEPIELGIVTISRWGSGFDINYDITQ